MWPIIDPILVTLGQLSCFLFLWIEPFFRWMKTTLLFICSTNILVRLLTINMENCLTPKKSENVRPHFIQSSLENGAPSSGISPVASYKEVPPPHLGLKPVTQQMQKASCHVKTSLRGWNWLQLTRVSLENKELQLYNSNFIRSEIKLYKNLLLDKCNQIIDTWN